MTARRRRRILPWILSAIGAVVALAAGAYAIRGDGTVARPAPPSLAAALATPGASAPLEAEPKGQTDELVALQQERLQEKPDDFGALINLSNAYLQKIRETGDPSLYGKAEDLLDRAEGQDPQNPELFASRGMLALLRHDFAAAEKLGKQALVQNPDSPRYRGIVGDAQIELGRYEDAIESYQQMVDRRPDFASYSRVSHARELFGDLEGAQEAMEFAIGAGASVPENMAWARVQLGNLSFNIGNVKDAGREYAAALKLFPRYAPALAGQARVAAARGNLDKAAALYTRAFDRSPLSEYAIALGDVYEAMGNGARAAEQRDLVLALDKLQQANGVNTDMEIALYMADHGIDAARSIEKARTAYEARPSIYAADVLAWTLHRSGKSREARKYVKQALKLGTRDPLLLFHAGVIAEANGEGKQARQYLSDAVGLNPHFSLLWQDDAAAALRELKAGGAKTTAGGK